VFLGLCDKLKIGIVKQRGACFMNVHACYGVIFVCGGGVVEVMNLDKKVKKIEFVFNICAR